VAKVRQTLEAIQKDFNGKQVSLADLIVLAAAQPSKPRRKRPATT